MKIGNIQFPDRPLFLAPMEDVTDIGFRMLCKRFGAQMVYTEFVSAEALIRSIKSTVNKLNIADEERPVGIQIYGRDTEAVVEAAKIVEDQAHPDVIDLNFGCPVKKVAGKGAGAGMLQNLPKLLDITKQVVDAVKTPVTVKTRLGWNSEDLTSSRLNPNSGRAQIIDLAEALQDCGIKALTIHGRTRAQMYTGDADWTLIGEVKNNPRIQIPIIGNGDIKSIEDANKAFDTYGVDAVMIGRGLLADPALAERIKGTEADGTYISRLKEYVRALCDAYFSVYKDERNTLFKMKELWNFLASNTKDSEKTLRLIRRAHDLAEYKATVNRVFDTE